MEIEKLKALVTEALDDVKGQDIQIIDVRGTTSITDYMVIASGTSSRQVKALAQNVVEESKKNGVMPIGTEGEEKAEWVLVDLGDVIVHVMQASTRDFYQLEKLWAQPEEQEDSQA